jgi:hypothetical protein
MIRDQEIILNFSSSSGLPPHEVQKAENSSKNPEKAENSSKNPEKAEREIEKAEKKAEIYIFTRFYDF